MLDRHEQHSDLCVIVNLVQVVPGTDRLMSMITIQDEVIPVWKEWLRSRLQRGGGGELPAGAKNPDILWVDRAKSVGLQVRVRNKRVNQDTLPILVHQDEEEEEAFASYDVDIEGKTMYNVLVIVVAASIR